VGYIYNWKDISGIRYKGMDNIEIGFRRKRKGRER
jgi:hypothetical protein